MNRSADITALINKAENDFEQLKTSYKLSLNQKHISNDLKVIIKNIFENLRSCLDYFAHDTFNKYCCAHQQPKNLYFPICKTKKDFESTISKRFPDLDTSSPAVLSHFDAVQPYRDPWLSQFNTINNENKHLHLVEQTRTEDKRVTVSNGSGQVSWGSGVSFGNGVRILGVPIDPNTQLPVPNAKVNTEIVIWVDVRFKEIDQPVLPFVSKSILEVKNLFEALKPLL
jgi:hypothetical protein